MSVHCSASSLYEYKAAQKGSICESSKYGISEISSIGGMPDRHLPGGCDDDRLL